MDAETPPERPGGGSGGEGPKAFAVGYKAHSGDMMVYGGGALTLIGVLAAVLNGAPSFLLASLAGSLSALYFYPTLDVRTPQLGANIEGLYVARIGVIPWSEIKQIHVHHHALRTMHLATLIVTTARPLSEAVSIKETLSPVQRVTARNVKVKGNTIRVSLHTLALPPQSIERRLRTLYTASGG
ncbi:MAG: hypothetical protein AAGF45_01430 [Pseudomonadota bacterium]